MNLLLSMIGGSICKGYSKEMGHYKEVCTVTEAVRVAYTPNTELLAMPSMSSQSSTKQENRKSKLC